MLIKRIFYVLIALVVVTIGVLIGVNNKDSVTLNLIAVTLPSMSLGVLFILTLAVGFILGWLLVSLRVIGLRVRVSSLRRQLHKLQQAQQPKVKASGSTAVVAQDA